MLGAAWSLALFLSSVRPLSRAPRERVLALQRRRLARLLRHAKERSPLYGRLLHGVDPDRADLAELPVVEKRTLMDSFDGWLTDRSIRLADLEAFLQDLDRPRLYRGRLRVMTTSGSTGRKGVFVYEPRAWAFTRALLLRPVPAVLRDLRARGERAGMRPRFAIVATDNAVHASSQFSASAPRGLPLLRLASRAPVPELCERLAAFRPDVLGGFPSIVARLAREASEGRLRIAPRVVVTSGETLPPLARRAIREAWGREPFDQFGTTETMMIASECERHEGMHVSEDACILEVVDGDNRPVPPGERGERILVTNLFHFLQPTIRYAISDVLALDPRPCPCGSPFLRIARVEGRREEYLRLPRDGGGEIEVHPFALEDPLDGAAGIREYALSFEGGEVRLTFVPRPGAESAAIAGRVETQVAALLRSLGAARVRVACAAADSLPRRREGMDKASVRG